MDKAILREKYLRLRKQIDNKEEKSRIIKDRLIKLDEYLNSKKVGIYYSMDQEVDTKPIIEDLLDRDDLDLLIIPGICFDLSKNRVGYGKGFYANLSQDLRHAIPDTDGFSETSVRYAKRFYELYFQLIKNLPQVEEILNKKSGKAKQESI